MEAIAERIDAFGSEAWRLLWPMAWEGSILILAVLLLTLIGRRGPACFKYALWLLVALKLALPVPFALPTAQMSPVFYVPEPFLDPAVQFDVRQSISAGSFVFAGGISSGETARPLHFSPLALLAIGWLAIALGIISFRLWRYRRIRRLLLRIAVAPDARMKALADAVRAKIGLRRGTILLQVDDLPSPVVLGFLRPVVLMPDPSVAKLNEGELSALLAHEFYHLKRRDHWVLPLEMVALALHWFNPLAWLAVRRLRDERERATDDAVVAMQGDIEADYGSGLLKLARMNLESRNLPAGALSLFERRGDLAARIKRIMIPSRRVKPKIGTLSLAMLLALGCILLPAKSRGKAGETVVNPTPEWETAQWIDDPEFSFSRDIGDEMHWLGAYVVNNKERKERYPWATQFELLRVKGSRKIESEPGDFRKVELLFEAKGAGREAGILLNAYGPMAMSFEPEEKRWAPFGLDILDKDWTRQKEQWLAWGSKPDQPYALNAASPAIDRKRLVNLKNSEAGGAQYTLEDALKALKADRIEEKEGVVLASGNVKFVLGESEYEGSLAEVDRKAKTMRIKNFVQTTKINGQPSGRMTGDEVRMEFSGGTLRLLALVGEMRYAELPTQLPPAFHDLFGPDFQSLEAEEIHHSEDKEILTITGNVRLKTADYEAAADKMIIDCTERTIVLEENASVLQKRDGKSILSKGDLIRLSFDDKGKMGFHVQSKDNPTRIEAIMQPDEADQRLSPAH